MPAIRIRENGLLELRFYYKGRQYSVYDREPNKLLKKLKIKTKELAQSATNLLKTRITVKDWFDEWVEKYKKPFIKEQSYKNIKIFLNKHIYPKFANIALEDITTNDIQTFLNKMPRSRNKDQITIYFNAGLKKAVALDLIRKNPFDAVVQDRKTRNTKKAFNIEEQKLLLEFAKNSKYYLAILTDLCIGARTSELLRICKNDVSLKNRYIRIHGTKTGNKIRFVDCGQDLLETLINLPTDKNGRLFPFTVDEIGKYVTHALKALGIKNKRFYCCRHSFATNHYFLGTPAKQVQEWLGHSSIKMTLDTYTNIEEKWSAEEIRQLYNNFYYYN